MDPVFKFGYSAGEPHPYSSKNLLFDEAHWFLKKTKWAAFLERLRDGISKNKDSLVALFTGTPVQNDTRDAKRLIKIVKGGADRKSCSTGFVSRYCHEGKDYPVTIPIGVLDMPLLLACMRDLVKRVKLVRYW